MVDVFGKLNELDVETLETLAQVLGHTGQEIGAGMPVSGCACHQARIDPGRGCPHRQIVGG